MGVTEKRLAKPNFESSLLTATVEIKTGQKSVLEYLFRPLQNVTQALRER